MSGYGDEMELGRLTERCMWLEAALKAEGYEVPGEGAVVKLVDYTPGGMLPHDPPEDETQLPLFDPDGYGHTCEHPDDVHADPWAAVVSGALYDFLGYLTSRSEACLVGSSFNPTPALKHLETWAAERRLKLKEPNIAEWRRAL